MELTTALAAPLSAGRSWSVRDYASLTKPRIMSLLVLTAACAMVAAAHDGSPRALALGGLIAGGALACGGASALNHVLDRDIDRLMGARTASRPVAAGRISARRAAAFGLSLSASSFLIMSALDNVLTAALTLAGGVFYVLVYTRLLKRSTAQNIVIGGAAGAVPPLAGWAAARGSIGLGAFILFLIVLLWTPPHFWALALLIAPAYEAAGVPMMPVVRGRASTTRQILLYTFALTAVTLGAGIAGTFPPLYLAAAAPLDAIFIVLALRLWRKSDGRRVAALLFHYSLLYLALLFVALAVAAVV
jgi:protoheme IX farnesyltransferase